VKVSDSHVCGRRSRMRPWIEILPSQATAMIKELHPIISSSSPPPQGVLVALAVTGDISEASREKMSAMTAQIVFKKAMFALYLEVATDKSLRLFLVVLTPLKS